MDSLNTSETSGLGNCFGGASISLDNNEEVAHPIFRQIDEDNIATVKNFIISNPKEIMSLTYKEMSSNLFFLFIIYSSS